MHLHCFNGELCKLVHFQIRIVLVSSDQREIRQMPTSIFGAASLPQDRDREDGGGGRKGSTQNCFPFLVKIGAAGREERKGGRAIRQSLLFWSSVRRRAGRVGVRMSKEHCRTLKNEIKKSWLCWQRRIEWRQAVRVIMTIIALRFPFLFLFGGGGRGEGMTFDRVIYLCGEAGGGGEKKNRLGNSRFSLTRASRERRARI